MAYSDPQSLTVGGTAKSLPRTGMNTTSGRFQSSDQKYSFTIAHNKSRNGRIQHVARIELSDVVSNPLVPSTNTVVGAAVTLTVNQPLNGLSSTTIADLAKALVAWSTAPNVEKLVGNEI